MVMCRGNIKRLIGRKMTLNNGYERRHLRIAAGTLVLVLLLLFLPESANAGAIELAYDDGTAEGSWSLLDDTYPLDCPSCPHTDGIIGHAVKFSPGSTHFKINTIKVFGERYGNDGKLRLEIWNQNKTSLYSATFNHSDYFTTSASWAYITVPNIDVFGDFYVVIFTYSHDPGLVPTSGMYISYDDSSSSNRSYTAENYNSIWWTDQETINWMIRVIGNSEGTSTISVDADGNGIIDDLELLAYIQAWVDGRVSDYDLLATIAQWAQ